MHCLRPSLWAVQGKLPHRASQQEVDLHLRLGHYSVISYTILSLFVFYFLKLFIVFLSLFILFLSLFIPFCYYVYYFDIILYYFNTRLWVLFPLRWGGTRHCYLPSLWPH